jgi:hypothetical protein
MFFLYYLSLLLTNSYMIQLIVRARKLSSLSANSYSAVKVGASYTRSTTAISVPAFKNTRSTWILSVWPYQAKHLDMQFACSQTTFFAKTWIEHDTSVEWKTGAMWICYEAYLHKLAQGLEAWSSRAPRTLLENRNAVEVYWNQNFRTKQHRPTLAA